MILIVVLLIGTCAACSKAASADSESTTSRAAEKTTEEKTSETTQAVTQATTKATEATTKATEAVTKATESVTKATKAEPETNPPVETSETQAEITTEGNNDVQVEASTQQATEAPTTAPAQPATEAPTPAPTQPPTQAPAPQIPGVVCWGDSITYGFGGQGTTYPDTLRELLNGRGYNVPVVNNGICGETTYTILARTGKINFYLKDGATMAAGTNYGEVNVTVDGGQFLNLCGWSTEGLNPVSIGGVMGNLSAAGGSGEKYGFTRFDSSAEMNLGAGAEIVSYGRYGYPGYVNILLMGQNGTYSSDEDLLEQNQMFVNGLDNDKYIIIGLLTGDNNQRDHYDAIMEQRFGRKYISMRKELIARAREITGTPEDWSDVSDRENGRVYSNLWSDSVHMKGECYRAMGVIVFDRMVELGYIR